MSALPPAVADAFALLRRDLYVHLDEAEFLAARWDDWSGEHIEAARDLIPDLVRVIRALLGEHAPGRSGDCATCGTPWPCPVVRTVHDMVKDPDRQFVTLVSRSGQQR